MFNTDTKLCTPQHPSTLPAPTVVYLDCESSVLGVVPRSIVAVSLERAKMLVESPSWIVHAWSLEATEDGTHE